MMSSPRLLPRSALLAAALLAWALGPVAPAAAAPPPPPFRSIDGSANNPADVDMGRAEIPLRRIAAPEYADGAAAPAGAARPSARAVSNAVAAQSARTYNAAGASSYLWQWGQFIDHDIDLTEAHVPPESFGIPVPADDPDFAPAPFIGLDRSTWTWAADAFDPAPRRQQLNQITAWLDASMVYGSDDVRAVALRDPAVPGALRVSPSPVGDLLMLNTPGLPNAGGPGPTLFLAGDVRANEQIGLTAMHTLLVREHNRRAAEIRAANPGMSADTVYETARAWMAAHVQAITYEEFLPLLLGAGALPPYAGYDSSCDADVANLFSTAAYRFGHSTLSPDLLRLDDQMRPIAQGNLALADAFFRPDHLVTGGGLEPLLRGLAVNSAQEIDPLVTDAVRNFLFGAPGAGGFDLAALNIQRGRDHGLPSYAAARAALGLAPRPTLADVSGDPDIQARLASAYASPADMDVWVGGLAEDPHGASMLGELFHTIVADQFMRLRDCDRFWYEATFTGSELAEARSTTLADLIRRNTTVGAELPDDVFRVPTLADVSADLSQVSAGAPVAGESFAVEASATNHGPYPADTLALEASLPADARFRSATPSAGGSCTTPAVDARGGTVSCTWPGDTAAGGSRSVTIDLLSCGDPACGTELGFAATASSDSRQAAFDAANDDATLDVALETRADLAVSIADAPDPVIAGQQMTYAIDVRNLGPSASRDTELRLDLDSNVKFVSATGAPCVIDAGGVTCQLGDLGAPEACDPTAPPTAAALRVTVAVDFDTMCSIAPCTGEALAGAMTMLRAAGNCLPDPDPTNNERTVHTDVLAGADLEVWMAELMSNGGQGEPRFAAAADGEGPTALLDKRCIAAGDMIMVRQAFGNTGPEAFTAQPDNPGPEFEVPLPDAVVGLPGSCRVLEGGGRCRVTERRVMWDGRIEVGAQVIVEYEARIKGGLPVGTEFALMGMVRTDTCNAGLNEVESFSENMMMLLDCEPIIDPNTQLDGQVHLPILNFLGQDDVCETWIEVQNIGCDFAKAALITWGEPGFCPPQAAGPLKVECTGMLKPGSTWNLLGAQVPTGSKSGILYQFTTQQLSEIGVDLGFDDIVGDYLCETLFFGVVGDSDDYRRFMKAYRENLEFAGVPLDRAKGDGALAVDVHRTCPGDATPGVEVTSKYNGIAGTHLGVFDEVFGGYGFYVPLVYADASGFNTIMYIQNGGLQCSSVEVWFQEQDACLRASICEILTLAPGESYQLDASDCVGPDFQGSAWLRSSQVMGIAVDLIGRDVLMTYVAEPAEINYTYDPTEALYSAGNQVAFGPLIYSEYQGWDSGVQVQNLSAVTAAKVKVYFLDKAGGIITTLVDWVCPRGSQTFFLPVIFDLPGNWVGSVRVESQEWFSPGNPLVAPPNIVAVATLLKYDDAARTSTIQALAYNLLPEHKIYDWQIASGTGGNFEAGVGLIALPSLLRDVDQLGLTSEVAIANVVPKPGFTDFAVFIYDQNGLLDYFCQKLSEKQVEYLDLATWGYVNPGFKGSAIISATFWEHDVFDDQGFFLRNLVGLGAVAIERKGRRGYEADIPGDEAAGSRGIPFASTFDEDGEPIFEFCFMGYAPLCPGLPDLRPDPAECPAEITASCENCPLPIPATGTAGMMDTAVASIGLTVACEIVDVDVSLDLNHTFNADLDVDLTSPAGTRSRLFDDVCGGSDNMQVVLDDDAASPIGSVCPPTGFAAFTTENGIALDLFDGELAGGEWRLDITDDAGGDTGRLNGFEVRLELRAR